MPMSLKKHYRLLLGLDSNWEVLDVELDLEASRVEIELQPGGGRVAGKRSNPGLWTGGGE
jgi:hypothetical protein